MKKTRKRFPRQQQHLQQPWLAKGYVSASQPSRKPFWLYYDSWPRLYSHLMSRSTRLLISRYTFVNILKCRLFFIVFYCRLTYERFRVTLLKRPTIQHYHRPSDSIWRKKNSNGDNWPPVLDVPYYVTKKIGCAFTRLRFLRFVSINFLLIVSYIRRKISLFVYEVMYLQHFLSRLGISCRILLVVIMLTV